MRVSIFYERYSRDTTTTTDSSGHALVLAFQFPPNIPVIIIAVIVVTR
jgi:hypothetical protein